jgi:hypothetical protein
MTALNDPSLSNPVQSARQRILVGLSVAAAVAGSAWYFAGRNGTDSGEPPSTLSPRVSDRQIRELCSHCHTFPPADSLERSEWRRIVSEMAVLPGFGVNVRRRPLTDAVIQWYEERAPDSFDFSPLETAVDSGGLKLDVHAWSPAVERPAAMISHVRFVELLAEPGLEMIVCDMRHGGVWLGRPLTKNGELEQIADVPHPAHVEVVDLDGDGLQDLLVANLGSFLPLDHNLGTVEWIRQTSHGTFSRHTILTGLGRVADIQAADLDDDGDLDLVVGEFGWRATGHVLTLENTTTDWAHPAFIRHDIDGRNGAIHVPVVDLNGDGLPDVVALLAQQHEVVAAFLNRGNRQFEVHELFRAPHPAWGSSGMHWVDLDRDGDLDVLLTNGDTLDDNRIKPYHGVQWLENQGNLKFVPHALAVVLGAHRAEAADLDGDGDLDIAVSAFTEWRPQKQADGASMSPALVGLLWLEQTDMGHFKRHNLSVGGAIYPTLSLADYDGDGDVDLAVGRAVPTEGSSHWVEVWENKQTSATQVR